MVLDHTIIDNLGLKSHLCQLLLLLLIPRILIHLTTLLILLLVDWLVLPCVLEALFMPSDFIIADLHDKLDIVLNYHVKEVTNRVLHRSAGCDDDFLLEARIDPRSIDVVVIAVFSPTISN